MKKLFNAIRKGDLGTVRTLLQKDPALIACTAQKPPAKDDGQSPLQVALKCGQFAIARKLLDCGADVHFMEAEDCSNSWRMPVVQCAIMAAVMSTRWNTVRPDGEVEVYHTRETAEAAFDILRQIMEKGAKIEQRDSFGNSCLQRALLDARQILPVYDPIHGTVSGDRILTPELRCDLAKIFSLLLASGADRNEFLPLTGKTIMEEYGQEPVGEFLK